MILGDVLRDVQQQLQASGCESAARDARVLTSHVVGIASDRLTLELGQALTVRQIAELNACIARRVAHEPVSRIIGKRLFWGRWFDITPDVLDPRGDTETLIALALEQPFENALDMGTGSGCIAITLAAETSARIEATDISQAALNIAQANALKFETNVEFYLSDWFDQVAGRYDLIVSNPPYITEQEMKELSPDVAQFDPHLALTPGGDGLAAYREIARSAPNYLTKGGRVLVEIGHRQAQDVCGLFAAVGFGNITTHQDLDGKDRVVEAFWI